ncbi:MAG: hypothetical protein A2754_01040 [Candidatus Magasanikbacteria bacterium RIFCSPHIGHO2_01_FULL_47_8]|uniref:DoxX family protein n=1 Tax=Candidatus Magasanikbacteria bacterium RIFCSPHIGHO2_01_FULL_47_8 TaxID=1798673 RepID=A0A1F6MC84_9BACT|nr:MAG: hypothetical protein A2754_01040 [Candidatus Magasanikbacteria bacterium RIFCSPHIGHO2_01_FULL_47_8]
MVDFFTSLIYNYADWAPLSLRVAVGFIFLAHGLSKWKMWKMQSGGQMSSGMLSIMRLLSIVEPLGALAILAGFLTQLAAVGLGIVMLGALKFKIFVWKAPFLGMEKLGWELDLMLLGALIALVFLGPGVLSVDWFLGYV